MLLLFLTSCSTNQLDCGENENDGGVCVDTTKPVIEGVKDVTIYLSESIDLLEGISAIDDLDGDLTKEIEVTENIDPHEKGKYLIKYTVEDSSGNKTIEVAYVTVIKEVTLLGNLLTNGDFSSGLDGYGIYHEESNGEGVFEVVDGVLEIEILSIDNNAWWKPRLDYQGITFLKGDSYRVSFDVKADDARWIQVQIGELVNYSPWFIDFAPYVQKTHYATDEYQTVTFDFTMNHEDNFNGAIILEFGYLNNSSVLTTVYIDNIEIRNIN